MNFLKTANEELIALSTVAGFFEQERADGTKRVFAVLHPSYSSRPMELERIYSLESLWLALDPARRR
jgi:hypothetical protein